MILQKDWFMRQIEAVIAAIVHFLSHTGNGASGLSLDELALRERIREAVQKGNLCQTEDWLMEHRDETEMMWLRLSVDFYSALNRQSDTFLREHNFSREEIYSGVMEWMEVYGLDGLL